MKDFDEQNEELELEEDDEVLGVDEEIMRNHNEVSEEFPGLDAEEPVDEEQEEEKIKAKAGKSTDSWRVVLRDELTRPEYNRDWFKFKYRGEKYTGRVLHELNPNKFVFLINDVMKGIWINEATIV